MALFDTTSRRWLPWAGLAALLLICWGCYHPGLAGGFLFDDFVNLDALGSRGPIDNADAFWRYLTSGTADPIGRPLSLLTFLLDARDWPADPWPFLRTNVLLHLSNGLLLFLLLRELERALQPGAKSTDGIACLGAGLWLLHPLWVSTTLYIVQREAMLPATVSLLALIAFVRGRRHWRDSGGMRGGAAMALSIMIGTPLAMACKANGMLLPLLALVLVLTVFATAQGERPARVDTRLRRLDVALLLLPTLVVLGWLALYLPRLDETPGSRPWTLGQRLLTEPRVLLDYLGYLAVPRAISPGLFNDDFPASTGWLAPATTLPAIVAVIGLGAFAWRGRRRYPRLSAGLLFFLVGHLLESTVVPLELYFEHRNYLPALLLLWPLAAWLLAPGPRAAWRVLGAAALLGLLALTTWQRASLWGDQEKLSATWALRNPDSSRAQAYAAIQLVRAGHPERATALLDARWRARPDDLQLALNYANARCAVSGLTADDTTRIAATLRITRGSDLLLHDWLASAIDLAATSGCPGLTIDSVDAWLAAGLGNPYLVRGNLRDQNFRPLLGRVALARHQPDMAQDEFRSALLAHPNPDFAARLVTELAMAGYPEHALALLDTYEALPDRTTSWRRGMSWLHAKVLARQNFWPHEFAVLREKLQQDVATRSASPPSHD